MDLPIQETNSNSNSGKINKHKHKHKIMLITLLNQNKAWSEMALCSLLVLSGQSAATLLGRLYYEKGGKSKYLEALVQTVGFPILLPLIFLKSRKNHTASSSSSSSSPSSSTLALPALYICFGTFLALDCILYSIGLMYLPLSTFSLLCSTQLGFNAIFSYLINSHKLTPSILNSILLLTLSAVLLALLPDSSGAAVAGKTALGFVCTLSGAAGYALLLSVEQLAYGKVMRRQTMKEILNVIFFESMVASCVLVFGLIVSGEWRGLKEEMEGFGLGRAGYAGVVAAAAVAWQGFSVGMVSLILKVSSLFGNVVSAMGVPVVPVLAVVVFKDRICGVKVVALLLALWGCMSYVYQQYLDHDGESRDIANVDRPIGD